MYPKFEGMLLYMIVPCVDRVGLVTSANWQELWLVWAGGCRKLCTVVPWKDN